MIKVLAVDDSALMRKVLGKIFETQPDFSVAFAKNGVEGLAQNKAFKPDVITLDIQMPEMDGLACLDRLMVERPCPVVMLSSLTEEGAEATLEALRLGAVDVLAKPGGAVSLHIDAFGPQLVAKVRAAAQAKIRSTHRLKERVRAGQTTPRRSASKKSTKLVPKAARRTGDGVVLIGVSTGGPPALEAVLTELPATFPWPIVIAQHMPATFTGALARRLNKICRIKVMELDARRRLEPGVAYIGKGDGDIVLEKRAGRTMAGPAVSEPDYLWHPSVDRMVRSALEAIEPAQLIGVLMTGMGNDGASAMALLCERGGVTIAESEESAIVWGMPGELVRARGADFLLPLSEIAAQLQKLAP